ncbi:unnamed protein product [Fusarium fujikuroi]|nr:unnamed protein product [Fusarium fujikuroi]
MPSHIYKRSIDKLTVMHMEWQKLADWYATLLKSRFKLQSIRVYLRLLCNQSDNPCHPLGAKRLLKYNGSIILQESEERVATVIIQKSRAMRAGHKLLYKIFHLEYIAKQLAKPDLLHLRIYLANKELDEITDKNIEFISPKANNSFRFKLLLTPPESPLSGFFYAIEDNLKVKRGGKPASDRRPKVIRVKKVWPVLRTC